MHSEKEKLTIEQYRQIYKETIKHLDSEIIFMNDGFCPLDENGYPLMTSFRLAEKYKKWQNQVLLYQKLLETAGITTDTKGNLLEISCGLGGGITFISEYYNFDNLYGLDILEEHINYCKHKIPNVNFIESTATNIPLENNSLDFIITVEAFFHYNPISTFLKECNRILKPKGLLCIATNYTETEKLNKLFLNTNGMKIVKIEDITQNCNIGSAISKWVVPNTTVRLAIKNDETRHFTQNSVYEIIICQKN